MTTHKNYIHFIDINTILLDGKKYNLKENDSDLINWECPHCGKSRLVYDLKTVKSEHYATCKERKKNKK